MTSVVSGADMQLRASRFRDVAFRVSGVQGL